jgi:hypothetical protein
MWKKKENFEGSNKNSNNQGGDSRNQNQFLFIKTLSSLS